MCGLRKFINLQRCNWNNDDTLLWIEHFRNISWKRTQLFFYVKVLLISFKLSCVCLLCIPLDIEESECFYYFSVVMYVSVITLITKFFEMIIRGPFQRHHTPAYNKRNSHAYSKSCKIPQCKLHVQNISMDNKALNLLKGSLYIVDR